MISIKRNLVEGVESKIYKFMKGGSFEGGCNQSLTVISRIIVQSGYVHTHVDHFLKKHFLVV